MADPEESVFPEANDLIEVTWPSSQTKEKVFVLAITNNTITVKYIDDEQKEELHIENNELPFEWKLIEKQQQNQNEDEQQDVDANNEQNYNNEQYDDNHNNDNNDNGHYNDQYDDYSQNQYNNNNYNHGYNDNNNYYQNKGNRWQPKNKQNNNNYDNNYNNNYDNYNNNNYNNNYHNNNNQRDNRYKSKKDYFQQKRQKYDQNRPQQNNNNNNQQNEQHQQQQEEPKMKRKEVPQQRTIARSLSAVTTSTNPTEPGQPPSNQDYRNQQHQHQRQYPPTPQELEIDSSRLPLKGDIVEISYSGGSKNDPVRLIHTNYFGDARIRYADSQGAGDKISLFRNTDISWQITNSVFDHDQNNNFIPAPRVGDIIEIRWTQNGGRDTCKIIEVTKEYTEEYLKQKDNKKDEDVTSIEFKEGDEEPKKDINHYKKFKHIWVEIEYQDDAEREKLDFHPMAQDSEILSWRIMQCGKVAGLKIDPNEIKFDVLDDEICTVCCTSFKEFPYRTVVPCAHNNVCAKCTLRMRVFGDFTNEKHPYPMCPFCKESWEIVAFIPLSWTIAINHKYDQEKEDSPMQCVNIDDLSQHEWDTVFSRPMEYDDEIQCYFTDIHILQKFIHIRSLYCLLCNPPKRQITNYNKVYYYHNVGKLLGHLRHEHTSFMCELCLNNANLFIDEQRIFLNNKKLLIDHERNGSPLQDQYGETAPHPFCTLCRRNFYNREALFEHCEDSHASCHLCKQSGILEYYANPDILAEHHRTLHHLCEHPECLAKLQPVVFDDPVLLKSHQLQAHRWNKPVSTVRTAFTYGDDNYNQRYNGTMNFSTMFSQEDIQYLNVNRYGGINQQNNQQNQQPINMSEEQRLRNEQQRLHRQMDDIKRRWFPNQLQRERQLKKSKNRALQLGLRHIPDAAPTEERAQRQQIVIAQIKKQLISELNFKQFQMISHQYKNNKISSSVFFYRFKGLFQELCAEQIWVDILIQMLALLRDGKKRRSLYEEYRDWVIGGRINRKTRVKMSRRNLNNNQSLKPSKPQSRQGGIARNARKPAAPKTNVKTAATIAAGTYRKPTKEQIMSERRAQKLKAKVNSKAMGRGRGRGKTTTAIQPIKQQPKPKANKANKSNKSQQQKKSRPQSQQKQKQKSKPKAKPIPQPQPAPQRPSPVKTTGKGAWGQATSLSSKIKMANQPKKKVKQKPKQQQQNKPKPPPKITYDSKKPAPKHWPGLGNNKNNTTNAVQNKKIPQWVSNDTPKKKNRNTKLTVKHVQPVEKKKQQILPEFPSAPGSKDDKDENGKKKKRGGKNKNKNKKKKSDSPAKKVELFQSAKPIQHQKTKSAATTAKVNVVKATPKGEMPHQNKDKKDFDKARPWGNKTSVVVTPSKPQRQSEQQQSFNNNNGNDNSNNKKKKKKQKRVELFQSAKPIQHDPKQYQAQNMNLNMQNDLNALNSSSSTANKKQKQKGKQQEVVIEQKVQSTKKKKVTNKHQQDTEQKEYRKKDEKKENNGNNGSNVNKCYFEHLKDALSELQGVYVKLGKYKKTLFSNDKIGLFLVFLFECLYPIFENNFNDKLKYSSQELTKQFRQHIYQTVYDQFWSKYLDLNDKTVFNNDNGKGSSKKIKLKESTFKLRENENILEWTVIMNLPNVTQNIVTQISSLYDMLVNIDDDTMDMSPLKMWLDQMDLPFHEIYPILLYLWFIIDTEIPSPPYNFIAKRGANNNFSSSSNKSNNTQKKASSDNKQNRSNQQQQQQKKKNNNKKKQNKKKKPELLFKMGGM